MAKKKRLDKKSIKNFAKIQVNLERVLSVKIPAASQDDSILNYKLGSERTVEDTHCQQRERECVFFKEMWDHCVFLRDAGVSYRCPNRVNDYKDLGVDSGKIKYSEGSLERDSRIASKKESRVCEDILRKEDKERKKLEKEIRKKQVMQTIELLAGMIKISTQIKKPNKEIKKLT